jgi:hypothetical protein
LLARDNDRGVLLREVNQLCYRRIFWANSFVGRVARNAPQRDRDLAWDRYMDSVENWSASLVINQAQPLLIRHRHCCAVTANGTHTGTFMGIPATNRVSASAFVFLTIVDGKVTHLRAMFDQMGLMRQLGVVST